MEKALAAHVLAFLQSKAPAADASAYDAAVSRIAVALGVDAGAAAGKPADALLRLFAESPAGKAAAEAAGSDEELKGALGGTWGCKRPAEAAGSRPMAQRARLRALGGAGGCKAERVGDGARLRSLSRAHTWPTRSAHTLVVSVAYTLSLVVSARKGLARRSRLLHGPAGP
jgi:hypothetical protein